MPTFPDKPNTKGHLNIAQSPTQLTNHAQDIPITTKGNSETYLEIIHDGSACENDSVPGRDSVDSFRALVTRILYLVPLVQNHIILNRTNAGKGVRFIVCI